MFVRPKASDLIGIGLNDGAVARRDFRLPRDFLAFGDVVVPRVRDRLPFEVLDKEGYDVEKYVEEEEERPEEQCRDPLPKSDFGDALVLERHEQDPREDHDQIGKHPSDGCRYAVDRPYRGGILIADHGRDRRENELEDKEEQAPYAERDNGDRDVVGGELVVVPPLLLRTEQTLEELDKSGEEHDGMPARPTHSLAEHDGDRRGLLVEEFRVVAIHDLEPLCDLVGGEFPILGDRDVFPAILDEGCGIEIARPRNTGGAAADGAPARFEAAGGDEVDPVQAGHIILAEVARVAVGRDGVLLSVRHECLVHAGEIVGADHVIGVEHKETVEILRAEFGLDKILNERAIRVTQRAFVGIVVFIDMCAVAACDLGGLVRTVVRTDEDLVLIGGIIVRVDAVDELSDDLFFVPPRDDDAVAEAFVRLGVALFLEDTHDGENGIMQEHETENRPDHSEYHIEDKKVAHFILLFVFVVYLTHHIIFRGRSQECERPNLKFSRKM